MAIRASIRGIRKRLDAACVAAAAADQDGMAIEHLNHNVLELAHELGRRLIARTRTPTPGKDE